jgi:hypothetical protein
MQKINQFSFPPPLRSGSLRSPPLRGGGKEKKPPATTNNPPQSTKFISGLDQSGTDF